MLRAVAGAVLILSFGLIMFGWAGVVWAVLLLAAGTAYGIKRAGGAREGLRRLDDLLFQGERAIVAVALVTMSVVVFLDVVWRTARSVEGGRAIGFAAGIFALTMIGAFTARLEDAAWMKRVLLGLGAYALMAIGCFAIYSAPNGFGWSQTLAMILLLWVGLIGTSMATKEGRHIAVDAVKRVVPERLKRPFEITACLVTVALSAFLTVLGVLYCQQNWLDWVDSDYRSFVFESIPIPYWAATLPIPIGFGLTAIRFIAIAIYGSKQVDVLTAVGGAELDQGAET